MGKLIVTEFMTLDGVGQAPGEPNEDRDGGCSYDGWQVPLLDEGSGDAMFEQARTMDALLLGRRTYEIFADYWPKAPEEIPFTGLLDGVPKYVTSHTLAGLSPGRARRYCPAASPRASPHSRRATTRYMSSAASSSHRRSCGSVSPTG
jgi:dihydrofolate reductase